MAGERACVSAVLAIALLVLALASPASAASGTWDRAWGKNVKGGGVFETCTVAVSCMAGTPGGLGGEMDSPFGVATDAAGNVYVADNGNNRIQKFDASGNWERTWGKDVDMTTAGTGFEICTAASGDTCQGGSTGVLGGEMDNPQGIATDAAGNVYVMDANNRRVHKFDASGNWERTWGKDVDMTTAGTGFEICTATSGDTCQRGSTGGLGGEMNEPEGLAIAAGNVYVADYGNRRIQKFDASGTWQLAWGKDVDMTTAGTGFEICTAASGDTCQRGSTGGLGGEMNGPSLVGTDSAGNVYVTDYENYRLQKFDASGNWDRTWGKDVDMTTAGTGFEICTAASGDTCQGGTAGSLGGEIDGPEGVATDAAGNVYVAEDGNQRIQKFDSSGNWLRAWGKNVNGGGVFGVCTVAGSCLAGAPGGLAGEMNNPEGIAADAAGNVYVADFSNNRIQKFAADPLPPKPSGEGATGATGRRAAALKRCKKKHRAKRKKCRKKARRLPV
jgi:tripartite motif-containing protein 71